MSSRETAIPRPGHDPHRGTLLHNPKAGKPRTIQGRRHRPDFGNWDELAHHPGANQSTFLAVIPRMAMFGVQEFFVNFAEDRGKRPAAAIGEQQTAEATTLPLNIE